MLPELGFTFVAVFMLCVRAIKAKLRFRMHEPVAFGGYVAAEGCAGLLPISRGSRKSGSATGLWADGSEIVALDSKSS